MKCRILGSLLILIMAIVAVGCTTITVNPTDNTNENGAVPEVEWYINEQSLPDSDEVGQALSDYILEKLNIKVNVHYPQDYTTVGTALTAGQDVGLVTFGNQLDFATYVGAGALYPLEDLLEKYGQGVKALFSDEVWKAMTVNDHIYGVPIKKDNCYIMSKVYNADLAEELGIDMESIHFNNWNDFDEKMLCDAVEKRNELHPEWAGEPLIGSWLDDLVPMYFGVESFLGNFYAVCTVDGYQDIDGIDSNTVFNLYATNAFREVVRMKQRLVEKGVLAYDYSKLTGYDTSPAVLLIDGWGLVYVPEHLFGDAFTSKLLLPDKVWADTASYTQCHGIAANCKEPEAAMKLLELIDTDPWVATTLRFGIEGKHYTRNSEGKMEITPENSDPNNRRYYHWYGASMGNLMVVEAPEELTGPNNVLVDKIEYYNNNAINSPHLGFIPDTSNIANEIAACDNVVEEYISTLSMGQYESQEAVDAALDEFLAKLEANGVNKIIEEIQYQIDEFNKGK